MESKSGRMLPVVRLYTVGKIVLAIVLAFLILELFWRCGVDLARP